MLKKNVKEGQNNGGKRVPFPFQSRIVALTINKCDIKHNQFNQP